MLTVAAMLGRSPEGDDPPELRLIGAAPLAALMATARLELGRERTSSGVVRSLNAALVCGSAPPARAERR